MTDSFIVDGLVAILKKKYRPLAAYSGEEGLLILRKEIPSIIILDIMMEPMDGWETAVPDKGKSRNPSYSGPHVLCQKDQRGGRLRNIRSVSTISSRNPSPSEDHRIDREGAQPGGMRTGRSLKYGKQRVPARKRSMNISPSQQAWRLT